MIDYLCVYAYRYIVYTTNVGSLKKHTASNPAGKNIIREELCRKRVLVPHNHIEHINNFDGGVLLVANFHRMREAA